jgi:hypothetical protein
MMMIIIRQQSSTLLIIITAAVLIATILALSVVIEVLFDDSEVLKQKNVGSGESKYSDIDTITFEKSSGYS